MNEMKNEWKLLPQMLKEIFQRNYKNEIKGEKSHSTVACGEMRAPKNRPLYCLWAAWAAPCWRHCRQEKHRVLGVTRWGCHVLYLQHGVKTWCCPSPRNEWLCERVTWINRCAVDGWMDGRLNVYIYSKRGEEDERGEGRWGHAELTTGGDKGQRGQWK